VQNLTPLTLSSAEKSVTVQTQKQTNKQVRPSLGTAVYPHMPIKPCDIDRQAITRALPILKFSSGWVADLSDFGLLGEQSSPKWEIHCSGHP